MQPLRRRLALENPHLPLPSAAAPPLKELALPFTPLSDGVTPHQPSVFGWKSGMPCPAVGPVTIEGR